MMWVSVVHIEADQDPGYELVTLLRERFGLSVRTRTQAGWLYEAERAPVPPMGKPHQHQGNIRQVKLGRSTGQRAQ